MGVNRRMGKTTLEQEGAMTDQLKPSKLCWELTDTPFPQCYKLCKTAQHLGVGECESITDCAMKFKKGIMLALIATGTGGRDE